VRGNGKSRRERDHCRDEDIACAPGAALRLRTQQGFDDDRICEQAAEAAEVAGGVEIVRVVGVAAPGAGIPGLQQWRCRGCRGERRADRKREHADEPKRGILGVWLAEQVRHVDRQHEPGHR